MFKKIHYRIKEICDKFSLDSTKCVVNFNLIKILTIKVDSFTLKIFCPFDSQTKVELYKEKEIISINKKEEKFIIRSWHNRCKIKEKESRKLLDFKKK